MCNTRKEGDDNVKRSPAGKAYSWGVIDSTQKPKNKTLVLFRTTPKYSQGNNREKLYVNK